jgi:hypothetical protein
VAAIITSGNFILWFCRIEIVVVLMFSLMSTTMVELIKALILFISGSARFEKPSNSNSVIN